MANPLFSSAIILVSGEIEKTANYYKEVLGFEIVENIDREDLV